MCRGPGSMESKRRAPISVRSSRGRPRFTRPPPFLFPDPRTLPSQNPLCVWLGRHPPLSHTTLCVSFAYEISLSSRSSVCSPTGSSHFLFISSSGSYLLSDQTSPRTSLCAKRQMDWIWKTFFFENKKAGIPLVPATIDVAAVKANTALAVFV